MKGVFALRPSLPRYNFIWDANIVLEYLKNFYPYEGMSLFIPTHKLVMLLALATAQRWNIDYLEHRLFWNFWRFGKIPNYDTLKTTSVKNRKFVYIWTSLHQKYLCVFTALNAFLKKTEQLRGNEKYLFVTINLLRNHIIGQVSRPLVDGYGKC